MKSTFLFSLLLTTMVFAACSNDDNGTDAEVKGTPVVISLKVENGQSTRAAISNAVTDEDAVINDLIVFVFRNNGDLDVNPLYVSGTTLTATGIPTINASTRASSIYVVCNTGALATGAFKNVFDLAELQRVTLQVNGNPNATSNCISKNVWMTGSTTTLVDDGVSATGIIQKNATISLGFIPAKVYVIVKNEMINYSATGKTLLNGTAVVNGGAWTRFLPEGSPKNFKPLRNDLTTPTKTPFFYNGVDINPAHFVDVPVPFGANADYAVNSIYNYTSAAFTTTTNFVATPQAEEAFYLFPAITNELTYLTVYGKYSSLGATDPSAVPYYWPVAFNGADGVLGNLESGKKYIVTIRLSGDADYGAGGDADPTSESTDMNINVTVQVAQWDAVVVAEKMIN